MSTASTVLSVTGLGFLGALRAELLKTYKRWAPWILLILQLVIIVGLSYFLVWLLGSGHIRANVPEAARRSLLAGIYPGGFAHQGIGGSGLTPILALLLGALLTGTDFGSGTLKTLFTMRPARVEALAAKFTSIAIAVAVGVVVVFAVTAGASALFAWIDGASLTHWPPAWEIVRAMLGAWLIWGWWALFGATLAILFQNMALAIGIGLAYQVVLEALLLNIGVSFHINFFIQLKRALPGPNAGWVEAVFPVHQAGVPVHTAVASGANTAGQAALILAGWCVVALVVSGVVVARRDVV
ncbi:MAG: ABC transporter permease [Candidatus Dormibacteraeota bacterium]|nr:ABC transporter permease [Candidatus Dormibacteraeota bacterium]